MNINVHIERLVLDGVPLSNRDGDAISLALQNELARLVGVNAPMLSQGFNVHSLRATSMNLGTTPKADALGQGIARSLYSELNPNPKGNRK